MLEVKESASIYAKSLSVLQEYQKNIIMLNNNIKLSNNNIEKYTILAEKMYAMKLYFSWW